MDRKVSLGDVRCCILIFLCRAEIVRGYVLITLVRNISPLAFSGSLHPNKLWRRSVRASNSFLGRLQQSCKPQKVFRDACSIPAKSKKFFAAFAAFLQSPESFSWHLQRCCKRQKVFRGTCSIPADVKANAASPAELPQGGFFFVLTIPTTCR